jgi:hypothetical protein
MAPVQHKKPDNEIDTGSLAETRGVHLGGHDPIQHTQLDAKLHMYTVSFSVLCLPFSFLFYLSFTRSLFFPFHLSSFYCIFPSPTPYFLLPLLLSFFFFIFLSSSPSLFRLLQPYFFYSIYNSTITSVPIPLHLSSLTSVYFLPFLPLHLSFPHSIFLPSMIHLS